jgi:ubiquitination network signaling protein AcrB
MPPRGPSSSKRQQGVANQRDTRHENGLVGPGKRVTKQKSNGHLNGHAKAPESNSSTPPLPATPPATNGHARYPALPDNPNDPKMPEHTLRRSSVSGYSDSSLSEAYHNAPGSPVSNGHHREIDAGSVKKSHSFGHLDQLSTVLRSLPLQDTLAILIVLLQIPPTFLSIVHLLFATLTFVPPSSTSLSALNFPDILNGSLGTPSIATIFFVDALVLLVWLFLWSPLQDIALDLAQMVIALTLGGGVSGREAGVRSVLWCFGIIGVSHFSRNSSVKPTGLRAIISSSSGLLASPDPDDPLEPMSHSSNKKHGLVRSILAIHILTQGVVRYIRDWYVRREKRDSTASMGDPEAGKAAVEISIDPNASTQTPDTDSSTSLPVSNTVTTKKKKKQSAQVRIQQPLWAALASTKIVMVKEYETSHTAAESAGTNATDINNLGDAPFHSEPDRIWITYVGSDEVCFNTSFFPAHTLPEDEDKGIDVSGIDEKKPFFVRVNQTDWHATRINATPDPDQPAGKDIRWSGEIFGLAPLSNYECDFISTLDNSVLFSSSVRTLRSPTTDSAAGLSPNPQGRPNSPITTLRTSIASAKVKLDDEKTKQKGQRKEQRAKLSSARKDIDKLSTSIANAGGSDDRQKNKIIQNNHQARQADEACTALDAEIAELRNIPSDDTSRHSSSHAEFKTQRKMHKQKQDQFNAAKLAADEEVQALKEEISSLQQKHERYESRITLLNERRDRITDANAKGMDEVQRKDRERQAKREERNKINAFYTQRLHLLQDNITQGTAALNSLTAAIEAVQQAMYADSPSTSSQNLSAPFGDTIPENSGLPPYTWNSPSAGIYATSGYAPMLSLSSTSQGHRTTRGRSSSMLSNVSGFTQSSGEGPSGFGPVGKGSVWEDAREERKASSGSGSSAGDPKSPTVGNGKLVSSPW